MKFIAVGLIIAMSVVASLIYVKQTKTHTKAVRQCIVLIENIKILIEYKNYDIKEILNQLLKSNNYNLLEFIISINNELYENCEYDDIIKKEFNYLNLPKYFDNEDSEYLYGFFSMFGKSDVQGQIANCELYKKMFQKKLLILENSEKSKCKSITTLIYGVGLMLSILIV